MKNLLLVCALLISIAGATTAFGRIARPQRAYQLTPGQQLVSKIRSVERAIMEIEYFKSLTRAYTEETTSYDLYDATTDDRQDKILEARMQRYKSKLQMLFRRCASLERETSRYKKNPKLDSSLVDVANDYYRKHCK